MSEAGLGVVGREEEGEIGVLEVVEGVEAELC